MVIKSLSRSLSREFLTAVSVGLLLALIAALVMILGGIISNSMEAVSILAAFLSVIVACLMVGGLLELRVAFGQLRFETLNKIYESLSEERSVQLEELKNIRIKHECNGSISEVDEERTKSLSRFLSRQYNRIGHYVYKDYMDSETMMEEFGGLIIRSWGIMKPYLKLVRDKDEFGEQWFMRRYYLMLVAAVEGEMIRRGGQFVEYLDNIKEKNFLNPQEPAVPAEWLASDVLEWLKEKRLYNYVYKWRQ